MENISIRASRSRRASRKTPHWNAGRRFCGSTSPCLPERENFLAVPPPTWLRPPHRLCYRMFFEALNAAEGILAKEETPSHWATAMTDSKSTPDLGWKAGGFGWIADWHVNSECPFPVAKQELMMDAKSFRQPFQAVGLVISHFLEVVRNHGVGIGQMKDRDGKLRPGWAHPA